MGGSKTPGRVGMRGMLGWGAGGAGEEGSDGAAAAAVGKGDATVDIGALMRKKKAQLLMPSGAGGGGLPSSRGAAVPAHFGTGLGLDVAVENPIYSPDDSLAKAASKLQSLKALRGSAARPLTALGAGQHAAADAGTSVQPARAAATVAAVVASKVEHPTPRVPPAPQPCDSPPVQDVAQRGSQGAEGGQRLSDEDSGELAALSALQRRRKSVAPGSAQKRYGSWFEGDDTDLEHTLHEYNRSAPAASPRMTRAQRRKSMAVDRSQALEAGMAKAALEENEAAEAQLQQQQQQGEQAADGLKNAQQSQPAKRAAGGRRKSMAATAQQLGLAGRADKEQAAEAPTQPALALQRVDSVAAEVDALNAEMCAQLEGMIEDSPDKQSRGDGRSLRDKLLESWDGKTYYERLMEVVPSKEQEEQQRGRQEQQPAAAAGQQRQPSKVRQPAVVPATHAAKTASLITAVAAKRAAAVAPATARAGGPAPAPPAAAAAAAARPAALQIGLAGGSMGTTAGAKATVLTPNTQRRKLNELTTSLQLLKVTSRHRSQLGLMAAAADEPASGAAAAAAAAPRQAALGGVSAAPDGKLGHQAQEAAVAAGASNKTPRSRSTSPPADEAMPSGADGAAATGAASEQALGQVAPKTGGKRSSRRGATPPVEAGAGAKEARGAVAAEEPAGAAKADAAMRGEVAAAYEMLNAALAEKEKLEGYLVAERKACLLAQQDVEQLRRELEQERQERQDEVAALKAAEQRGRQQHAKELADASAAAAAAAERAAEAEAVAERCAAAEKALTSILKAANTGLKVAGQGREEAKMLADALRNSNSAGVGGAENAPASSAASGRHLRQSGGGRLWR